MTGNSISRFHRRIRKRLQLALQGNPDANPSSASGGPLGRTKPWPWMPDHPFVGDHSPEDAARSIHAARDPAGWLSRSSAASTTMAGSISVGLPAPEVRGLADLGQRRHDDRQTTVFLDHEASTRKFPLSFKSKSDTSQAALQITGTGSGDFHIGAVSLMPADNVQGFRPDTIALLKDLHSGMWRLPGGNFLSDWVWYDATGDIDKRPPMFDYAWNAMQVNDVGMDEFMTLCKLLDVDPYVTVNAGLG
jgi:alpha-N-arabinofuranosidase